MPRAPYSLASMLFALAYTVSVILFSIFQPACMACFQSGFRRAGARAKLDWRKHAEVIIIFFGGLAAGITYDGRLRKDLVVHVAELFKDSIV